MKKLLLFISLFLYFVGFIIFIVAAEYATFILSLFAISTLNLAVLATIERKQLTSFIKTDLFKNICAHLFNIGVVFGILGLINFLVVKNDYYVDFTRNKLHTLSQQSKDAVNLFSGQTMHFKLFAKRETWHRYRKLMNLYQQQSKDIDVEFIDVNKNLTLVNLHKVTENGTLVIEYKKSFYKVVAKDELAVTNLLLKILSPEKKVIYYTVGHNEMSLSDKNDIGGDFLQEKMRNSNYTLKPLELHTGIPKDASALLILNPQIEFLEKEIAFIRDFIDQGGSLIGTLAPQFNGLIINNYINLLSEYGASFRNSLILDKLAAGQGAQASIPVVNNYPQDHKITKNFSYRTLFPISGFFEIAESEKMKWTALAKSVPFPATWAESDFEEVKVGKSKFNEDIDFPGPLNLAVAGEGEKGRIVLFSSSNFISNQFQGHSSNFNFFLNSLAWVLREESLMSLNRPNLEGNIVYLSQIQLNLILYFTVLFFPFVLFGTGIFFFRRKLKK